MTSHGFIEVNGHVVPRSEQANVPELLALFSEKEKFQDSGEFGYVSTVSVIKERLQSLGFGGRRANSEFEKEVGAWHARTAQPALIDLSVPIRDANMIRDELSSYLNSDEMRAPYTDADAVLDRLDHRLILRLVLDLIADDSMPVRYNLTSSAQAGLLTISAENTAAAREELRRRTANDAPVVILVEGSTDTELLTKAIQVTHPHLVGFLKFMDFADRHGGGRPQGGVPSLVKAVNTFVSAGIANRVLVLADNDTAAHNGLRKIDVTKLPDGYRVRHYPALDILRSYPTLGPQSAGLLEMDVNGLAGSLEMYLGRDILTIDGALIPVQWTGYVAGIDRYQGELAIDKKNIQDRFREKVERALRNPSLRASLDWSGIEAIVNEALNAFA